jgi:hypothetical protein
MSKLAPTHYEINAFENGEFLLSKVITKEAYDAGYIAEFKKQYPKAVGYLLPMTN